MLKSNTENKSAEKVKEMFYPLLDDFCIALCTMNLTKSCWKPYMRYSVILGQKGYHDLSWNIP